MTKKALFFCFLLTAFFGCKNQIANIEKRQIDGYTIVAHFDKDVIEGEANFFDKNGVLSHVSNYSNGVKNGVSVSFYSTGMTKDSAQFQGGLQNGFEYSYDENGEKVATSFFYYGIRIGPEVFFKHNKVSDFYFTDFNKEDLIECRYDSAGKITDISLYNIKLRTQDVLGNQAKMTNVFFYLPHPPGTILECNIGVANDKKQDQILFNVPDSKIFVDTLLPRLENGMHYFVSTKIINSDSSIHKVFIEEVKETR
jgi:hypothetical protein